MHNNTYVGEGRARRTKKGLNDDRIRLGGPHFAL